MNLDEYERIDRARYLELVAAVRHILAQALKAHPNLHVHAITGRAKEAGSLRKKLEGRGINPEDAIEDKIKDFAGCRIVLLTNAQMDAFGQTGIIHQNFEVLDVNVHHPVPGTDSETRLFDSNNYLAALKADRLAFPEYARFAGMQCEIQVQTLLNHAWAEMGHDTIYKQPSFKLGNRAFGQIKERMENVMRSHLLPAGHDFDKIARDFDRIVKGNTIADEAERVIIEAENNNDRCDALDSLCELVVPLFDKPEEFGVLIPKLVEAAERARNVETIPVETPFGNYDGKSAEDVIEKVAKLFRRRSYNDPEALFDALIRLYTGATSDAERQIWASVGEEFATHSLEVFERYGPAIPKIVVEKIEGSRDEVRKLAKGLFMPMLAEVLTAQLRGTSSSSTTVTLRHGSVAASEPLLDFRSRSIDLLMQYVLAADCDNDRHVALEALRHAGDTPHMGPYGNDVALMVTTDATRVYDFIAEHAAGWGLELRRQTEVDAHHRHYANRGLPPTMAEDKKLVEAQQAIVASLIHLRDLLNSDLEFVRYKILIGHDSVRPEAWDHDPFNFEATDTWRSAAYPSFIEEITPDTFVEWRDQISLYMSEGGREGTHVGGMRGFFGKLSREKPEIGGRFLSEMDDALSTLLPTILAGLSEAGEQKLVRESVEKFVDDGNFLYELLVYLRATPTYDADLLARVTTRAISLAEVQSLIEALNVAAEHHPTQPGTLIEDVLMPAIDALTDIDRPDWVRHAWAARHNGSLIAALNEEQSRRVLGSFVSIPEIDYNADSMLAIVAGNFPDLVLDFFDQRLQHDQKRGGKRFSPIPFRIHELRDSLSRHPEKVFAACRHWFAQDPLLYEYLGGRLLANVFPQLNKNVADALVQTARAGDQDDLKFVLRTLKPFEGNEAIYPICMEVVERLEPNDDLLKSVSDTLDATGVMRGEFGFVDAHAQQKALIDKWVADERPKVSGYAARRSRRLEQAMAYEQRRAEQEFEGRRREYGEA